LAWLSQVAFPFDAYNYTTFGKHCKKKVQLNLHRKSLTGGPSQSQAKNMCKKDVDIWQKACYTVLVMSENAYLQKPTQTEARMEIAGVEGTLEWVVDNLETQWCETDDIRRILTSAIKELENARTISRDAESAESLLAHFSA
jgi:hypothetical protein